MENFIDHDIVNFSVNSPSGVYRFYGKEIQIADGRAFIVVDNLVQIPLDEAFHIEKIGNTSIKKEVHVPQEPNQRRL